MKKLIILFILLFACSAGATTYYVDKTLIPAGDGLSPSTAWNAITKAQLIGNVPNGTHIVEIIEGSGPYLMEDFLAVGSDSLKHTQTSGTITWNLNGNALDFTLTTNDGSYTWVQSTADPNQYYMTETAGGGMPQWNSTDLLEPVMCVIDEVWNDDSMNLVNGNISYKIHNWKWGDFDTLGFSTLYVELQSGADPTTSGFEILINKSTSSNPNTFVINSSASRAKLIFNDAIIMGGGATMIAVASPVDLNRCVVKYCADNGYRILGAGGTASTLKYCLFLDAGHRAISNTVQASYDVYNNTFVGCHLAVQLKSNTAYTTTVRNNASFNLYAGGMQNDNATPTFIESNNQWHLDPDSTHAGKALAFTEAVRQWTTTDSTDFPAATDTSLTTSVDPEFISATDFHLKTSSVCINNALDSVPSAGDTDNDGRLVVVPVDIGSYQFYGLGSLPEKNLYKPNNVYYPSTLYTPDNLYTP